MPLPLYLVVKWAGRSLAATSVAGPTHPGRLFYVHDNCSNTRFLVDTGAEVSVVPPTHTERSHPQGMFTLQGVDGTQIATYGVRSCTLNIGLCRTFRWVFIIANVKQAILGADFLHHCSLLTCGNALWLILQHTSKSTVSFLATPLPLQVSHAPIKMRAIPTSLCCQSFPE